MQDITPSSSPRSLLLLPLIGLLIGTGLGLAWFWQGSSVGRAAAPPANLVTIGSIAPDFALSEVKSGKTIALSDYIGKPVIINFWATWCAPCRNEMPALQAASAQHASSGLTILAINNQEAPGLVESFRQTLELTFPILLDFDGEVNQSYQVQAYPCSYFVGTDGTIRAFHLGELSESQLSEYIARIVSP